jgi:hypothetical protein
MQPRIGHLQQLVLVLTELCDISLFFRRMSRERSKFHLGAKKYDTMRMLKQTKRCAS